MGINWKTFGFVIGAVAIGSVIGCFGVQFINKAKTLPPASTPPAK